MTLNHRSRALLVLTLGFGGAALAPACVNNDPVEGDGDGDGDSATTGGTGGDGDAAGGTSGDGDGDGDAAVTCGNGAANDAHVPEAIGPVCMTSNIPNCNISDFSAAQYATDGTWGDTMSLTGGSFTYKNEESSITTEVVNEEMNITGSITGAGYIGFGMWFGPCTDATDFDGIQITVSGSLDEGGIFDLQVNSDENYPIEERDNFGSCAHTEGNEYSDCTNNAFRFADGLGTMAVTYYIPWSEFTGGTPIATLSPNQLGGVQMQMGCDETKAPCDVNVTVYDIRFYRDHAPVLGMGGGGAQ